MLHLETKENSRGMGVIRSLKSTVTYLQERDIFLIKVQLINFAIILASSINGAQAAESFDIKFAFYSSAWSVKSDDGMRLMLFNDSEAELILDSITFLKNKQEQELIKVEVQTKIPPLGYAEKEFGYVDLLKGNECIRRTLAENWKLVEVSNYTLNPSVRNLIIEDTGSFRIYQCSEYVKTKWIKASTEEEIESVDWVLFHFETK